MFARFWMHARFLLVEGEKMSKSKGSFYTVRDVLDGRIRRESGELAGVRVHPAVLRLELIKSHYRGNMNFTHKGLMDSAGAVRRLNEFRGRLEQACGKQPVEVDFDYPILKQFAACIADDLNIAGGLGAILPWASTTPDDPAAALGALNRINEVLGVVPLDMSANGDSSPTEEDTTIAELCRQLDASRADKDYATADTIRGQIQELGYDVKTSPDGTVAEKRLA